MKYFDKIIGHELAKKILSSALAAKKVSNSYIFYGIEGIGKFTLAKSFAQTLICKNQSACGECSACLQFAAGTVNDFQVVDLSKNKDGEAKNSISVDDIRNIVKDIYLKPFIFDRKIYIIKNADKMTVEAQNALLKVYEEPPSYAVIILIVSNISSILPTILSRGVVVRFNPLSPDQIKECFSGNISDYAVNMANGSVKNARSILESDEYSSLRKEVFEAFINMCCSENKEYLTRFYSIFLKNEENIAFILDIISSIVYDILQGENIKNIKNIKNKDFDYPKKANIDSSDAYEIFKIISDLQKKLSTNAAYNLSVFGSLIEMYRVIHSSGKGIRK